MIQKSKKSMQRGHTSSRSKALGSNNSHHNRYQPSPEFLIKFSKSQKMMALGFVVLGSIALGLVFTWKWALKDLSGSVAAEIRMKSRSMQLSSQIRDIRGGDVGVFSDESRFVVPIKNIPKMVKRAFLAAEDDSFYSHIGISLQGIVRAAAANVKRDRLSQGASTITQQVVRQFLLTREKSWSRKIREIIMALTLEQQMSKSEILEIWFNSVYLGNNAWGVETASRHYFNKSVDRITLAEATLLAGLPQAPSRYAPHLRPKSARNRQIYVLDHMKKLKWITPQDWNLAKRETVKIVPPRSEVIDQGQWVTEAVRLELWRRLEQKELPKSGLVVNTTVDGKWQRSLQELVTNSFGHLRKSGFDMSAVVLDTKTGEIRSIIGGSDFSQSQFNRAIDLYRPIGTAIYPLVFSWAVERGHLTVDKYSSIAEAAVISRFAEAEQLAPEMGYGLVRDKLMGLGFVVKDAMAIDEMYGSPLTIARAYLGIAGARRTSVHGLISSVLANGETIYTSTESSRINVALTANSKAKIDDSANDRGQMKFAGDPAVAWVVRKWMAIGAKADAPLLGDQPLLKSIKGWNAWWIIPRNDVVIAAWVGDDGQDRKITENLRAADSAMDALLAVWIKRNLRNVDGIGTAPAGVSYQMYQSAPGRARVSLPLVVTEREVF
jgi:hypothetical protein